MEIAQFLTILPELRRKGAWYAKPHFCIDKSIKGHYNWPMKNKNKLVFFGNTAIVRDYCKKCKCYALIIKDKYSLCL